MSRLPLFLLAPALMLLASCGPESTDSAPAEGSNTAPAQPATPTVQYVQGFAVIDLNLIAQRLGSDQALLNALQQSEAQYNQQLTQLRGQLQANLSQREEELGEEVTEEQQLQLEAIARNMNEQFAQAQSEAQQQLNQQQLQLVAEFRAQVMPFAQEIARKRGFTVVLHRNDDLLFLYDQRFDITGEVIQAMSTPMVP